MHHNLNVCFHILYLESLGSRPVSLRIVSSTFFKLSLAFSSWSCKLRTATAILLLVSNWVTCWKAAAFNFKEYTSLPLQFTSELQTRKSEWRHSGVEPSLWKLDVVSREHQSLLALWMLCLKGCYLHPHCNYTNLNQKFQLPSTTWRQRRSGLCFMFIWLSCLHLCVLCANQHALRTTHTF